MTKYVALLRAVNVGGTGKLPMSDLVQLCAKAGFKDVRTYIASGNVVLESALAEARVKAALEAVLAEYAGKPVGVMVRSGAEMAAVLKANPFADKPGNRVMAVFLDDAPPKDALEQARHVASEELGLGTREIYIHYPRGQADTKLVVPAIKTGTARNMNTVAKLADMAS